MITIKAPMNLISRNVQTWPKVLTNSGTITVSQLPDLYSPSISQHRDWPRSVYTSLHFAVSPNTILATYTCYDTRNFLSGRGRTLRLLAWEFRIPWSSRFDLSLLPREYNIYIYLNRCTEVVGNPARPPRNHIYSTPSDPSLNQESFFCLFTGIHHSILSEWDKDRIATRPIAKKKHIRWASN